MALLLSSDNGQLLKKVIENRALEHEFKALEAQVESRMYEKYTAVALGHLKTAHEYRICLQVLAEISNPQTQLNSSVSVSTLTQ